MGRNYNPFTETSSAPGGGGRGPVWCAEQQADGSVSIYVVKIGYRRIAFHKVKEKFPF